MATVEGPAAAPEPLEVRSYRTVFDLERRIYRVDRLRLNPAGVPVRGVLYFIVLAVVGAALGQLPIAGSLVRALPWYLRDAGFPGLCAALLTVIRIEGRSFHLAARALARYASGPRHLAGLRPSAAPGARWRPPDLLLLPDGSDPTVRRMRFTGPGAVLISTAHERVVWRAGPLDAPLRRAQLTVRELPDERALAGAQVIELAPGARLSVQPGRDRRSTRGAR